MIDDTKLVFINIILFFIVITIIALHCKPLTTYDKVEITQANLEKARQCMATTIKGLNELENAEGDKARTENIKDKYSGRLKRAGCSEVINGMIQED